MNIIAFCGSARKGNTEYVLNKMLTKADKMGHRTDLVLLREKRIELSDGCFECDPTNKCKIKDGLQDVYDRMEKSDIMIFASPNYFDNYTGLMKNFIDRLRPFCTSGKLNGKKMVIVSVGGGGPVSTKRLNANFEVVADKLGLIVVGDIDFMAKGPNDVENSAENVKKVEDFIQSTVS